MICCSRCCLTGLCVRARVCVRLAQRCLGESRYITAKDLERLLFHLRDRLGLPTEEDIFVTMESGAELLKLDDLDDTCSIKVWSRKQAEEDQARMSRSANTPDGSRGGGGGGGGGSLLEEDDSSEEDEYEADPVASKAKLVEAAKVLWEAKYDADYKRGTALIVEASRLDKSALQARKMVEVAQRDGGGGASSVEMRVEALFICLETDPESMEGEAAKLAAECMKLVSQTQQDSTAWMLCALCSVLCALCSVCSVCCAQVGENS